MSKIEYAAQLRAQGMTCQQVGAVLGMSDSWVHKWTPRDGKSWRRWTPAEDKRLMSMKAYGQSDKHIAKRLGRSVQSVRLRWHRLPRDRFTREQRMRRNLLSSMWTIKATGYGLSPKQARAAVFRADVVEREASRIEAY